jgi:hypothetical protein
MLLLILLIFLVLAAAPACPTVAAGVITQAVDWERSAHTDRLDDARVRPFVAGPKLSILLMCKKLHAIQVLPEAAEEISGSRSDAACRNDTRFWYGTCS